MLFTQNDRFLIGVDNKNRVISFNKSLISNYTIMNKFNKSIKSIALLENDLLAIGTCDINKIEIWNITNKSKILNLNDHNDCVNALISSRVMNKTFLISGSADSSIKLYDNQLINIQTLKEHKGQILTLYYDSELQLLASNSTENETKIWSFWFKEIIEKKQAHTEYIHLICVLENDLIATGSWDTIKIWKNGDYLRLLTNLTEHTGIIRALILSKNNSLVSGSSDLTIKVWNQMTENTFECVVTLKQSSGVSSLAISGSSLLISGHADGTIKIFNQTSFVLLQTLKGHSNNVFSFVLLNNENLASVSTLDSIVIWQKINETSFNLSKTLKGHTDWVNSLAVLPNNMFASASDDNSIRIWGQTNLECINVLNAT